MSNNVKEYMVVAWDKYYPSGGMNNVKASFDTEAEALTYAYNIEQKMGYDSVQIVRHSDFSVVKEFL